MAGERDPIGVTADEQLIEMALRGESSAFRELFDRYRSGAYRVAYRLLGNHEDALDTVQEGFIKAFRALEHFEQRSSFKTWFMRIITNACLDLRRSRAGDPEGVGQDVVAIAEAVSEDSRPHGRQESPTERVDFDELRTALNAALKQLSEDHRTVFVLHTEQEMTYREIADLLGINVGTVMSRLFHARKNLQKILAKADLL